MTRTGLRRHLGRDGAPTPLGRTEARAYRDCHVSVCGRYATTRTGDQLAIDFTAVVGQFFRESAPDFNMAPTKPASIVVARHVDGRDYREIVTAHWGLIPTWAKDEKIASRLINARAETVAEKPSFQAAFANRRAIVPVDGYYEWYQPKSEKDAKATKQPFYISRDAGLNLAGIYQWWRQPDRQWRLTFSILTTEAVGAEGIIHDRAPLHVPENLVDAWLDPKPLAVPLDALVNATPGFAQAWPVSTHVNSVRNNGPDLNVPIDIS